MKKSIRCLNDPKNDKNGCKRSICECDKQLSENLGFWKQGHHQTQGDFDTSICEVDHNGNGGGKGPLECCGSKDEPRFPFRSGNRGCCGNKTYNTIGQQCCSNGDVRNIGAC